MLYSAGLRATFPRRATARGAARHNAAVVVCLRGQATRAACLLPIVVYHGSGLMLRLRLDLCLHLLALRGINTSGWDSLSTPHPPARLFFLRLLFRCSVLVATHCLHHILKYGPVLVRLGLSPKKSTL